MLPKGLLTLKESGQSILPKSDDKSQLGKKRGNACNFEMNISGLVTSNWHLMPDSGECEDINKICLYQIVYFRNQLDIELLTLLKTDRRAQLLTIFKQTTSKISIAKTGLIVAFSGLFAHQIAPKFAQNFLPTLFLPNFFFSFQSFWANEQSERGCCNDETNSVSFFGGFWSRFSTPLAVRFGVFF